jgi:glutathione S-transferase
MELIIANKNYSSWSLRPWLVMKQFNIPFEERVIPLFEGNYRLEILQVNQAGKVPALVDQDFLIWDSLAIIEYLADKFPDKGIWPKEMKKRAWARSVSAEMHSGFSELRTALPMNCRRDKKSDKLAELQPEIHRIQQIWNDCLEEFGGPFLFGPFTAADAVFAPVVIRFKGYGVELAEESAKFSKSILALPAVQEWVEAGRNEPWIIEKYENA